LIKDPEGRATYAELLELPFLVADNKRQVNMVGWVEKALEYRAARLAEISSGAIAQKPRV